ncbi:lamin tail domain-containing protein, partial [Patescibacteria group bacterium]|nr:lamin tail domain-containing protein [Patescibacteria group bacterium]
MAVKTFNKTISSVLILIFIMSNVFVFSIENVKAAMIPTPPTPPDTPEWRVDIQPGDILYDQFASGVGHVGLYIGDNKVIEAIGHPFLTSGYPGQVEQRDITSWDYPERDTVYLLRVTKPNDLTDDEWQQKILNAIDFVKYQNELNKPYDWSWYHKQSDTDSPSWYCSELVWAAYFNQGVDLESQTDGPFFDSLDPVSPVEIFDDEDTEQINSHLEGFDSTPWYRQFAPLFVLSPVNVKITDKDGNVLDENSNNIPNATFIEDQVDANGHKYSIIYLPVEQGPYQIEVTRKPDAQNGDTYSLKTQTEEGDSWLIQDWPVPEVDMSDKYNFPYSNSNFVGFSDTEEITNNTYQAGTLDLVLNSENDFTPEVTDTQSSIRDVVVENQGSLDFQYKVNIDNFSGDIAFCDDLSLKVIFDSSTIYDGVLSNFYLATSTDIGNLNFEVNSNISETDKICNFDFVFVAWQDNLENEILGFSDIEILSNVVSSDEVEEEPDLGVVLNEFLPNPNYLDPDYGFDFGDENDGAHNDMPQGEWIELYNNSDIAVDLTGWYIKDSADHIINITSLNTNPATTIISANNWLVVYMNKAFLNNVTGSNIEEIKLYNSLNELQDETSYTSSNDHCDLEPTPGEENDETGSGTCSGVPPNKS